MKGKKLKITELSKRALLSWHLNLFAYYSSSRCKLVSRCQYNWSVHMIFYWISSFLLLLLLLSRFSGVQLCETLWTSAFQAPLSMGFSRQQCYRVLPCPPPGDLSHLGMEPGSPAFRAHSLPLSHQGSPSCFLVVLNWVGYTSLCLMERKKPIL